MHFLENSGMVMQIGLAGRYAQGPLRNPSGQLEVIWGHRVGL